MLKSVNIEHKFEWIPLDSNQGNRATCVGEDQVIACFKKVTKADTKSTLTFRLGQKIIGMMNAKLGDKIVILQDKNSPYHYLLCKGVMGTKLSMPSKSASPQVAFKQAREDLKDFNWKHCNFYSPSPGHVIIVIPQD